MATPPRTVERKLATTSAGAALLARLPASALDALLREAMHEPVNSPLVNKRCALPAGRRSPSHMVAWMDRLPTLPASIHHARLARLASLRLVALGVTKLGHRLQIQQALRTAKLRAQTPASAASAVVAGERDAAEVDEGAPCLESNDSPRTPRATGGAPPSYRRRTTPTRKMRATPASRGPRLESNESPAPARGALGDRTNTLPIAHSPPPSASKSSSARRSRGMALAAATPTAPVAITALAPPAATAEDGASTPPAGTAAPRLAVTGRDVVALSCDALRWIALTLLTVVSAGWAAALSKLAPTASGTAGAAFGALGAMGRFALRTPLLPLSCGLWLGRLYWRLASAVIRAAVAISLDGADRLIGLMGRVSGGGEGGALTTALAAVRRRLLPVPVANAS